MTVGRDDEQMKESLTHSRLPRRLLGAVLLLDFLLDGSIGSSLVRGRHDIFGESQVFSKVIEAFGGQEEVLVSPVVNFSDIASGEKRLHEHQDLEVGHLDVGVRPLELVLLDHKNTLFKEVGKDGNSVFFPDEHFSKLREVGW